MPMAALPPMAGAPPGLPGPPPAAPAPPEMPPGTPPQAAPQGLVQEGLKARAYLQTGIARKLLETALPTVGSASEEGKAIISALSALKKVAPTPGDSDLTDTEVDALKPGMSPGPPPGGGMGGGAAEGGGGVVPRGPTPAMLNLG